MYKITNKLLKPIQFTMNFVGKKKKKTNNIIVVNINK